MKSSGQREKKREEKRGKGELAVEVESARDLVDATLDLIVEDEGHEDLLNLVGRDAELLWMTMQGYFR